MSMANTGSLMAESKRFADVKLPGGNGGRPEPVDLGSVYNRAVYARELGDYIRTGVAGEMMRRHTFTLTSGSGGDALLPRELLPPVRIDGANPFRSAHWWHGVAVPSSTDTTPLAVPVLDIEAGGEVAENAGSESAHNAANENGILTPTRTFQSGSLWISNTLLGAAGFDLVAALAPRLEFIREWAMARAIAAALVADAGVTQAAATSTPTGLTYADLLGLAEALPDRFDPMRFIVLSRAAHAAAGRLLDSAGLPLVPRDPNRPGVLLIAGVPAFRLPGGFEAFTADNVIGVVASLVGFVLRDVDLTRVVRMSAPTRPDQTGVNVIGYAGYGWDPAAVAKLRTAAV